MTSEDTTMSDAKKHSLGLQFSFQIQQETEKLIIQASSTEDLVKYVCQIEVSPYIDFNDLKQLISEGQFNLISKTKELLKIKLGATTLELFSKQLHQIQKLKAVISKMNQKQSLLQNTINSQKDTINKHTQLIENLQKTIQILTTEFQNQRHQISNLIYGLKKKYQKMQTQLYFVPLGQKLQSIQWSQQLKSDKIKVNKKSLQRIQVSEFTQYCLLNVGFSNKIKRKQCWAIKINKIGTGIWLGVCLKSIIKQRNFSSKNVDYRQIGHGLYSISFNGCSNSHTSKQQNAVRKSFKFDQGDVIYIEYNPIVRLLRFRKNKDGSIFQLSIPAPPIQDSYNPCVIFGKQFCSVELVLPGQSLS